MRLSEEGVSSGVSRFTVGLGLALANLLQTHSNLNLVFVGRGPVPPWIKPLLQAKFLRVEYLSLPGCWVFGALKKLSWIWSSWAFWSICNQTDETNCWLAPANSDAPLQLCSDKSTKSKVFQVVHDLIPISHPESVSRFFSLQLKLTLFNSIRLARMIPTVSDKSAQEILDFAKNFNNSKKGPVGVFVIGNGIESQFGAGVRLKGHDQLLARAEFLNGLGAPVELAACRWVCSVGRGQSYKRWDVAESACENVQSEVAQGVLFLRVGIGEQDFSRLKNNVIVKFVKSFWFPKKRMLCALKVTENELAQIYRLSDLCLHPSNAEGFGLPPLESVFCGTPVLFRKGTAVDECFANNRLPLGFVTELDSDEPLVWAKKIADFFKKIDDPCSEISVFMNQFESDRTVRGFIEEKMAGREYTWEAVALRLLSQISA